MKKILLLLSVATRLSGASNAISQIGYLESELPKLENENLLITGSFRDEKTALEKAKTSKIPVRELQSSRFLGLKSGLFIHVYKTCSTESDCRIELNSLQNKVADAYLKNAGKLVSPAVANDRLACDQLATDIDVQVSSLRTLKKDRESSGRYLDLKGVFDSGKPKILTLNFHQSRSLRSEIYAFSAGTLIYVESDEGWDVDDPKDSPGDPIRRQVYLENGVVKKISETTTDRLTIRKIDSVLYPNKTAAKFVERAALIGKLLQKKKFSEEEGQTLEEGPTY